MKGKPATICTLRDTIIAFGNGAKNVRKELDALLAKFKELDLKEDKVRCPRHASNKMFGFLKKHNINFVLRAGWIHIVAPAKKAHEFAEFAEKLIGEDDEDDDESCPICFCPPLNGFTMASCKHTYCIDCLSNSYNAIREQDVVLPLCCDHDGCKDRVSAADLEATLTRNQLRMFGDVSLSKYLEVHPELTRCPNIAECQFILKMPTTDIEKSNWRCDGCQASFCFDCTVREGKPIAPHPGSPCQADASTYVQHITNKIMNPLCPSCGAAFIDFNGCFALTCGQCKCGFCGWCLADCQRDAHSHVSRCPHNKNGGGYFGKLEQFTTNFRNMATEKVRAYIDADVLPRFQYEVTECTNTHLLDWGKSIAQKYTKPSTTNNQHQHQDVDALVLHITGTMMHPQCPKCRNPFMEFSNCFAVECKCDCEFCGWCFEECDSNTSHSHVANCAENPRNGDVDGTNKEFLDNFRKRTTRALRKHISDQVPEHLRDEVRKLVNVHLEEWGTTLEC